MMIASGDLWAGAEVMIRQLAYGLVKKPDMQLCAILLNHGRLEKELDAAGVELEVFDETRLSFLKLVRLVRAAILRNSPQVIHAHRYKENLLAWLASRGRKDIKLLATQHGMPEHTGQISFFQRMRAALFFRLLAHGFHKTILVSEEMRKSLQGRYGFHDRNITVVHNGVTIPADISPKNRDRIIVGTAGRLFPVKDYALFIEIAVRTVSISDSIDFVLAGDGPQKDLLFKQIEPYHKEGRIRMLGHQEDMDSFYRSIDVYMNTSVHEGIPMSVLEAMSNGVPVIAPKVGGFPEIIEDGISGYLVATRNPKDFSERLLTLEDFKKRASMASAARARAIEKFSRESMADGYFQTYRKTLSY